MISGDDIATLKELIERLDRHGVTAVFVAIKPGDGIQCRMVTAATVNQALAIFTIAQAKLEKILVAQS